MDVNTKIKISGTEYTLLGKLGEGGQGSVWRVSSARDGKTYAMKLLNNNDKNVERRRCKLDNIKDLVQENVDEKLAGPAALEGVNHVLPLKYELIGEDMYYIMELASGETLDELWADGTLSKLPLEGKLKLGRKIAKAIDILHASGRCYTDLSWGNIMWDQKTDVVHIIDCENIASSAAISEGRCFVCGTAFFIAPEVAFGKTTVGYASDRYAFATLFFRLLTDNVFQSAYHGKAMYAQPPACQNMMEVAEREDEDDIDERWRYYIFDPSHRENGADELFKNSKNPANQALRKKVERALLLWKQVDDRLKGVFLQAFRDPFDTQHRPTVSIWVKTIDEVLNGGNGKGKEAIKLPLTPTPRVTLTDNHGHSMDVTADETVLSGATFGVGVKNIGVLRKTAQGYEFESTLLCYTNIYGADRKLKGKLAKGQRVMLANGDQINPIVSKTLIALHC